MLTDVQSQPGAIQTLTLALEQNRLAHAYIFEGPSGVGKQMTALALAKARLCPDKPGLGCGVCTTCTRIDSLIHPDVRIFEPRKQGGGNIQVEVIREEVLPFARYAPFEGNAAFVIFPDADVSFPPHQSQAANALLKTLEEPHQRLHFILLTERPHRLLSTIRSRCQALRFLRLPEPTLRHVLSSNNVSNADQDLILPLADGRADRALWLAQDGRAKQVRGLAVQIMQAAQQSSPTPLLDLAEQLAKDEELHLVLEMLARLYYQQALSSSTLSRPLQSFDAIKAAVRKLERPINPQLALEALFLQLQQA